MSTQKVETFQIHFEPVFFKQSNVTSVGIKTIVLIADAIADAKNY